MERCREQDFLKLKSNSALKAEAVATIFDTALESGDEVTLDRITRRYDHNYLDFILGGYPGYIEEIIGRGDT